MLNFVVKYFNVNKYVFLNDVIEIIFQEVNLSYNKIEELPDLGMHKCLNKLIINCILF